MKKYPLLNTAPPGDTTRKCKEVWTDVERSGIHPATLHTVLKTLERVPTYARKRISATRFYSVVLGWMDGWMGGWMDGCIHGDCRLSYKTRRNIVILRVDTERATKNIFGTTRVFLHHFW